MAKERVLPDLKTRVRVDSSQLDKLPAAGKRAGDAIKGQMQTSRTHTLRFEQSLTTLLDHFGGMPPVVNEAGRSLESMFSQGVKGMALFGGGALVAVGAIAEIAHASMDSYQHIGEEVENFRRVSGASAEESSRLVHVFRSLGLESGTASQGMFKLSKAIETAPTKLRELGIEVQYNTAGNVDLSQTLFNVADAYNATADRVKRNTILLTAFGKSGRDMIPILEQGSASLRRMEASASLLFSADDLERLKQAKIHTQEVKSAWDEWWAATIGGPATAGQNAVAEGLLASAYAQKKYSDGLADGTIKANVYGPALGKLMAQFEAEYYATQHAREGLDLQTQATRDAAAANDALLKSLDDVVNKEEAAVNATLALERANLAVDESQAKVNQAQEAANAAYAKYGGASDEYKLGTDNYKQALIDQEQAYYADATAARRLQEAQDLANDGQRNAGREAQVYIDKLQQEADALGETSPLRVRLQAYIDKLKNEIPASVTTVITTAYTSTGSHPGGKGLQQFGAGGRPRVGEDVVVGDAGPEVVRFDQPATIYPHGQQPDSGGWQHITVEIPVVLDGQIIGRVVDRRVAKALHGMTSV